MSEENMEIVRRLFPGGVDMVSLFDNPDLLAATREAIEPFVHPELETAGDPDFITMAADTGVKGGRRGLFAKGVDGFMAFWQDWLSAWEAWIIGEPDFIDVDADRVVVTYELHARSKTGQVDIVFDAANLLTLREGKLTRIELFLHGAEALEAAGISE